MAETKSNIAAVTTAPDVGVPVASNGITMAELMKPFEEPTRDFSIKDRRILQYPPIDAATYLGKLAAGSQKVRYRIDTERESMLNLMEMYLVVQGKITKNGNAAVTAADAVNIASHFNEYSEAQLRINDSQAQTIKNPAQIQYLNTALFHTQESMRNTEGYHRSWDLSGFDATGVPVPHNCYSGTNNASKRNYMYLEGIDLSADGHQIDLENKAADTDRKVQSHDNTGLDGAAGIIKTTSLMNTEPDPKLRRRRAVIDRNNFNSTYTFRIPLSFFFPMLDKPWKYMFLPIARLEVNFTRQPDPKYVISAAGNAQFNVLEQHIDCCYYTFDTDTQAAYSAMIQANPYIKIPHYKYEFRDDKARSAQTNGAYTDDFKATGPAYVFATFTPTTRDAAADPFYYISPVTDNAADAVGNDFLLSVDINGKKYPANENLTGADYFSPATGNTQYAYDQFLTTSKIMGDDPDAKNFALDDFEWLARPIFCVRCSYAIDGTYRFDPTEKNIKIKGKVTGANGSASADYMQLIIAKEKLLAISTETGKVSVLYGDGED